MDRQLSKFTKSSLKYILERVNYMRCKICPNKNFFIHRKRLIVSVLGWENGVWFPFFFNLFIFYTAGSYYLSILYILVYVCQSQTPNSPPHTPPHTAPRFPPLVSICLFSISVSLFLPCKPVHLYHFSRFHIYALIYDISFSLSDLLHSVWQSLGPSMSLQMTQFLSFLWLSNIPLYIYTTPSLSIHLSIGI